MFISFACDLPLYHNKEAQTQTFACNVNTFCEQILPFLPVCDMCRLEKALYSLLPHGNVNSFYLYSCSYPMVALVAMQWAGVFWLRCIISQWLSCDGRVCICAFIARIVSIQLLYWGRLKLICSRNILTTFKTESR